MLEPRELSVAKKGVAFTLFTNETPWGDLEKIIFSFNVEDIDVESQRISALSQLHKLRSRSAWLIGDLLLKEEDILSKRYQIWLKRKEDGATAPDEKYTQPTKILSWVEANEDQLKFGVRQARRYLALRQTTDKDVADKLGVKKLDIISHAPDAIQDELKQKTMDLNWSATKLENEVAMIKVKIAAEKNYIKKIKPNLPKVNVKLDKKYPNRIIIETSAASRDMLNEILQTKYIEKIKKELYFALTNA